MIDYEVVNEKLRLIKAFSDKNKFINGYNNDGVLIEEEYSDATHYGEIIFINNEKKGVFDNGNYYIETEKDIPILEEAVETVNCDCE